MTEPTYYWDVQQGTEEWHELRCGRLTASALNAFITPAKMLLSTSAGARSATYRIVGEQLTGRSRHIPETVAMKWGNDYEGVARDVFSEAIGEPIAEVGFVVSADDELFGCSPDGLIGDDAGVEIKCPQHVENHLAVLDSESVPQEHLIQVLASLWITRRRWWHYVSYHPWIVDLNMAMFVITLDRTNYEPEIEKLSKAALAAAAGTRELLERLGGQ